MTRFPLPRALLLTLFVNLLLLPPTLPTLPAFLLPSPVVLISIPPPYRGLKNTEPFPLDAFIISIAPVRLAPLALP